ncbi:MAG: phosphate acyltransferase PlsX [Acidobacteriota bacterium]
MADGVTIAVDAMGGDFAPKAAIEGALMAVLDDGARVILVGDDEVIAHERRRLGDSGWLTEGRLVVEPASEVVAMDEPAVAVRSKRQASVRVCARLVREGRARAMVTAGHTGAAMIAAKTVIGTAPGVDRPALAAIFPSVGGKTVVLDVGANLDAKVRHLRQFAVMGHFYAQEMVGNPEPRIGLLSVGEEEGKGTDRLRKVYQVLKKTGLNFVGNVEGHDIFSGTVDVVVCDGFVGNAVLKGSEALARYVAGVLREELEGTVRSRLASLAAAPALRRFRDRVDFSEYGAAPLLGVRGGCFVGHGSSSATAIRNAVRRALEFSDLDVDAKIEERVADLHLQEARIFGDTAGEPS